MKNNQNNTIKHKPLSGVLLDKACMDRDDLNFNGLNNEVQQWTFYDNCKASDTIQCIGDAEVIISNKVFIGDAEMRVAKNLKLICIAATGTNNVDLIAAKKHNIAVCNVTAYATDSVVQHVFALILALKRNLFQYQHSVMNGHWDKSEHFCMLDFPISEISNETMGIIGYGELGQHVAKLATAFGMKVIVAESFKAPQNQTNQAHKIKNEGESKNEDIDSISVNRVKLDELYRRADIISLHCPLSNETNNLISQTSFSKMKSHCILINTARGGIINEDDLLQALLDKTIAAAAIDVLIEEPPKKLPLIEAKLNNLIVTPHIAWASQTARQQLVDQIVLNIESYCLGVIRNEV